MDIFIDNEVTKGIFVDHNTPYGYALFNKNSPMHRRILKDYMIKQGKYVYYNDGQPQDFDKKIVDGFYNHSFVIYNPDHTINSMIIYYQDGVTIGVSALFIDPKRVRIPLLFAISYFNLNINADFVVFNTHQLFIEKYYKKFDVTKVNKDTFYFLKNNKDPLAKFI